MTTIYKYALSIGDQQLVFMPQGAKTLCVQVQDGHICLWCEVVSVNPPVPRTVRVFGTGHPIWTEAHSYIGTVQQGGFVWHIYISDE